MPDRAPVRFTVRHIGRSTIQEIEMTDAPMTALKPCPFCGGVMTHNNLRLARCKTSGCYMHNFVVDMDDAGSVNRWNTRAPLTTAARDVLAPFQSRVAPWLEACFGAEIAADKAERNHRFLEEALELVQSGGCTKSEAYQLVDYVYGRPVGEMAQEVGGVMNTLAALCLAHGLDMHEAGEVELVRVWGKIDKIRAKQAAKPKNSPLAERNAATDLMSIPEVAALVEAARWIAENDDAGDMFYHAQGKFAKRASAALAPFTAAQGDAK